MEDDLKIKKKGRRPKKMEKMEDDLKKWKTNQSTEINLIGCAPL